MNHRAVIIELYQQALAGSQEAETRLFKLLNARFASFARLRGLEKEEQEEVVQNTLAAIAEKYLDTNIEVSFAAWIQRIFENKTIDCFRKKGVERTRFQREPDGDYSPGLIEVDPALRRQLLKCLKKVNQRAQRHARILVLRYQGFSFEEICSKLKVNRSNCYSILSRARDMLQKCLTTGDLQ